MTINRTKSVMVVNSERWGDDHETVEGIPVQSNGIVRMLGAAYSPSGDPLAQWLLERAQGTQPLFDVCRDKSTSKAISLKLLHACGLPRLNFILRTHQEKHLGAATEYFDGEVRKVLNHLADRTLPDRAIHIAQLPIKMGGLGLRSQTQLSKFAYTCVGIKSRQTELTEKLDRDNKERLIISLTGAERAFLISAGSYGAGKPMTDGQVMLSDKAVEVWLKMRLLENVLPYRTKCVCGAIADNQHVLACPRLGGNPKQQRHDAIVRALESVFQACAFQVVREPNANNAHNRARPDLLTTTVEGVSATDVTVTYPARVDVRMKEPFEAAYKAFESKRTIWEDWAVIRGIAFAPFVLESSGAVLPESRSWLRSVVGTRDTPFTIASTYSAALSAAVCAMHNEQVALFISAQCGAEIGGRATIPHVG